MTLRPKYTFRGHDGVLQALTPAHIIESGLPTKRRLAYIAVSKYADGLPLYRQEAIYLRDGVEISRSLMAQWMGHLGFELQISSQWHSTSHSRMMIADGWWLLRRVVWSAGMPQFC